MIKVVVGLHTDIEKFEIDNFIHGDTGEQRNQNHTEKVAQNRNQNKLGS